MRAFNNNQALKDKLVNEVNWHYQQDHVVQATYGKANHSREDFRGCAVGCTLKAVKSVTWNIVMSTGDHTLYRKIGLPTFLADLEERIFENSRISYARSWPVRFLEAIPVGATFDDLLDNLVIATLEKAGKSKDFICATLNNEKRKHEDVFQRNVATVLNENRGHDRMGSYDASRLINSLGYLTGLEIEEVADTLLEEIKKCQ